MCIEHPGKATRSNSGVMRDHHCIFEPGHNCWRLEAADRVSVLIDGQAYFSAFQQAAEKAQQQIFIVGWDVDGRLELDPQAREAASGNLRSGQAEKPEVLQDFLQKLLQRNRSLHIYVLDWDFPVLYAPDREWLPTLRFGWNTHKRLHFQMDSSHPVGASHHQKVVVIDDRIAFCGGIDFALGRWDTPAHNADDPRRRNPRSGEPLQPFHDLQMLVDGNASKALGDLCRQRWHNATGETLEPPGKIAKDPIWPAMKPDFQSAAEHQTLQVALARTMPAYQDQPQVQEIRQLIVDIINSASKSIYLENQYLTAQTACDALVSRLAEKNGPEVVILLPEKTQGWLSQNTMDVLRVRQIKRLIEADHENRLRIYHPSLPESNSQCLNLHAKVLIVDNEILRVGSANLNNRSMGLDTECDLALQANGIPQRCQAIAAIRSRLLAEHLQVTVDEVAAAMQTQGSLIKGIEHLRAEPSAQSAVRTLEVLQLPDSDPLDPGLQDPDIIDPEEPIDVDRLLGSLITEEDKGPVQSSLWRLTIVLFGALLLAAVWHWTPVRQWIDIQSMLAQLSHLRGDWWAPLMVAGIFVLCGLLVVPITLLIVASGLAFGAVYGFAYGLIGAMASALTTFMLGHLLGRRAVQRLSNRWVSRINRGLSRKGLLAMITLRMIPVAPFTVVNLVAGASHIRLRDFTLGTLIGMAPGTAALTIFSDQVAMAIAQPQAIRLGGLVLLGLIIIAATWWMSRTLLKRQQNPSGE